VSVDDHACCHSRRERAERHDEQARWGFVIASMVPRTNTGAATLFTTMKRVSLTGAPTTRAVQLANPSPPHHSSQSWAR
jgi:hypothetical protein